MAKKNNNKELKWFIELSKNENTAQHNFMDKLKTVPWGKFIALIYYIKKLERVICMNQWYNSIIWKYKDKENPNQEDEKN